MIYNDWSFPGLSSSCLFLKTSAKVSFFLFYVKLCRCCARISRSRLVHEKKKQTKVLTIQFRWSCCGNKAQANFYLSIVKQMLQPEKKTQSWANPCASETSLTLGKERPHSVNAHSRSGSHNHTRTHVRPHTKKIWQCALCMLLCFTDADGGKKKGMGRDLPCKDDTREPGTGRALGGMLLWYPLLTCSPSVSTSCHTCSYSRFRDRGRKCNLGQFIMNIWKGSESYSADTGEMAVGRAMKAKPIQLGLN